MLPIPVKRTLLGNHVEGARVPCSYWVWDTRVTPGRISVGTGDSRTDRCGTRLVCMRENVLAVSQSVSQSAESMISIDAHLL